MSEVRLDSRALYFLRLLHEIIVFAISYVDNFQRGLKIAWEKYLDGNEVDHIIVQEEDLERKFRGTTETELIARQKRRESVKREKQTNEEL